MSDYRTQPLSESVLDSSLLGVSSTATSSAPRPEQVGPYRILELLGEGGMGEVYKAERREPIRQTVAVKIIKLGFGSREIVGRFESERQALAMMDHPGIASVLDAGTTETGRPYFVMDFVAGKPITQFCDENRLSIDERLRLFSDVCDAIGHAHTKAIIHRDIKPSNVLAYMQDGRPAVKVIDFGVAKALTSARLTELTVNTESGRPIGTYDCMSPEQVEGSPDIDTRTDVYSLGVLLYELLTGAKPFDHATMSGATDAEIKRIIREVDPPRPSTRLSGLGDANALAERRQAKLDSLAKQLRSELEWIPLRAMRKERARRYASPLQLKQDIENYLEGRPLIAGPESRAYRVKKFVGRNSGGVATASIIVIALIAGVVLYINGIRTEQRKTETALREAQKQKDEATRQSEVATAVSDFLTRRVLAGATPERIADKSIRDAIVTAMLDPAAAAVERDFKDKPLPEAAVRQSLAASYLAIGRADLGLPHAQAGLALQRRVLGDDDPLTLRSIATVGRLLEATGNPTGAEALFREALDRTRRVFGADSQYTLSSLNNMGALLTKHGKIDEAEPFFRESLEGGRRVLGNDNPDTLRWMHNMAALLRGQGKFAEAETLFREALERTRLVMGDKHRDTLRLVNSLGGVLSAQKKFDEAEQLLRESFERTKELLGADHPDTLDAMTNLAVGFESAGRFDQAEPLEREILERSRRALGEDQPATLNAMVNLGAVLQKQGKMEEAEQLYRDALERSRRTLGEDHRHTLTAANALGAVLLRQEKFEEAESLLRDAREKARRALGEDHRETFVATVNLAAALENTKKIDQAEQLLRDAVTEAKSNPKLGPRHAQTRQLAKNWAVCLDSLGRTDDATKVRKEFDLPAATTGPTTAPQP